MAARFLWLTLGLLALGCGIVGIILPLIPTTPLLLLAAFAFARSSPRLHEWLVTHPRFGPPIQDWRAHGAIRKPAKRTALALIVITFAVSAVVGVSIPILVLQALVLAVVAAFIVTRPNAPGEGS